MVVLIARNAQQPTKNNAARANAKGIAGAVSVGRAFPWARSLRIKELLFPFDVYSIL